jgi:hypothetical protein
MQKTYYICRICKNILNMQNMHDVEYAEYDIPTDFARKELIHGRIAPDIELGMKRAELWPKLVHHEVEPPAIHGLIRAQKESAARTSSQTFFPVATCTGRGPSMLRMWATA